MKNYITFIKKHLELAFKWILIGTSLTIGLLLGVVTIKAFDWSGISSVETTTPLTANLWNTTMSTITGSIQTLEDTMVSLSGDQTIAGTKSFSNPVVGQVPTATDHLSTKAYVDGVVSAAGESNIIFSTCSTTDKKQMFYECDPTLAACSTVGAYCGGGKVAGTLSGSLIVSALSDEGKFTWGTADNASGYWVSSNQAITSCENKETFGFDGWSLPNTGELYLLYLNKEVIGNFILNTYWSSDNNSTYANGIAFNSGQIYDGIFVKAQQSFVRCIRKY
ncbi:MAG: hypothetical protein PHN31_05145 [Candidatus Gracilibacteria bacterium]|nr:hypothetical protein [Candidatus Gracilibacteria bacterium]